MSSRLTGHAGTPQATRSFHLIIPLYRSHRPVRTPGDLECFVATQDTIVDPVAKLCDRFVTYNDASVYSEGNMNYDLAALQEGLPETFVVVCGALVVMMQLGFTALESGLVDARNTLSVLYKNILDFCFGILAFAFAWWGASQVQQQPISDIEFFYDATFAATAATICSGALAGRIKLAPYVHLSIFITAVVYPLAAAIGFDTLAASLDASTRRFPSQVATGQEGLFYDMAGSVVVHGVGGFAALAAALFVGPRRTLPQSQRLKRRESSDFPVEAIELEPWRTRPHNLPLAGIGTFLLVIGWLGFNCGSVHSLAEVGKVALNTLVAGAAGGASSYVGESVARRPSLANNMNGILGGLVAVTASANLVSTAGAALLGAVAGTVIVLWSDYVCTGVRYLRHRLEDPVGAFAVHGLCGVLGGVCVPVFAQPVGIAGKTVSVFDPAWQVAVSVLIPAGAFILVRLFLPFYNFLFGGRTASKSAVIADPIAQGMGLDVGEYVERAYDFGTRSDKPEDLFEKLRAIDERYRPAALSFDQCTSLSSRRMGESFRPFSARFTHWLQEIELLAQQYSDAYGRYAAGSKDGLSELSASDLAERLGMAKRALSAFSREPTPEQKKQVFDKHVPELEAAASALSTALELHAAQRLEGKEIVEQTNQDLQNLRERLTLLEARVANLGQDRN